MKHTYIDFRLKYLIVLLFSYMLTSVSFADSGTLSYQGRLTDGSGVPITGSHNIYICLFNASSADYSNGSGEFVDIQTGSVANTTGNASLDASCQEFTGVSLTDGIFSVNIDLSNSTVADNVLSQVQAGTSLYSRVILNSTANVYSPQQITSTPIAYTVVNGGLTGYSLRTAAGGNVGTCTSPNNYLVVAADGTFSCTSASTTLSSGDVTSTEILNGTIKGIDLSDSFTVTNSSNEEVFEILRASNMTSVTNLNVSTKITATDLYVSNSISGASGSIGAYLIQDIYLRNDSNDEIAGNLGINTTPSGAALEVSGAVSVSGNQTLGGNLSVAGTSTLTGNTGISGVLTASNHVSITGTGSNLTVSNRISAAELYVNGSQITAGGSSAWTDGGTTVYPTDAGDYGSTGLRITDAGNLSMNGNLVVDGTSTLTGNLSVTGSTNVEALSVDQTLGVAGVLTASNHVSITGAGSNLTVSNRISAAELYVNGSQITAGGSSAWTDGGTTVYPTDAGDYGSTGLRITDAGNLSMNGNLVVDGTSTLTGNLSVTGSTNVEALSVDQTLNVTGVLTASNHVSITGTGSNLTVSNRISSAELYVNGSQITASSASAWTDGGTTVYPADAGDYGSTGLRITDAGNLSMNGALIVDGLSTLTGGAYISSTTHVENLYTNANVGIGHNSPSELLHVKNTGAGHAKIQLESTTAANDPQMVFTAPNGTWIIFNDDNDNNKFKWYDGTDNPITIDGANNRLGIGDTNPSQALTVSGNISASGSISATSGDIAATRICDENGTCHDITNLSTSGSSWTDGGTTVYPTDAGDYGSTGLRITDAGNLSMNGNLVVDGTSTLTGNTAITGNLSVTGTSNVEALSVDQTLSVTGASTLTGNTAITGNLSVTGTSNVEALSVDQTLNVTGASTLTGNTAITGNLSVTGTSNVEALSVDQTLSVTGASTLTGNTSVAGVLTTSNHVSITGTGSNLTVSNRISAAELYVNGTQVTGGGSSAWTDGGTTVYPTDAGDYGSTGLRITNDGDLSMNGAFIVDGLSTLTGGAYISSTTQVENLYANSNVGIGTASPAAMLQIKQAANNDLAGFSVIDSTSANQLLLWADASTTHIDGGAVQSKSITFNDGGTGQVYFMGGNVGINTTSVGSYNFRVNGTAYGTSWNTPSDRRFKKDIRTIKNAVQLLKRSRGVYYNWKKDEFPDRNFPDSEEIGVIAQEIRKVFPQVVKEDKEGTLAVDYSKMVGVLIQAVKELSHKDDQIKDDVKLVEIELRKMAEELEETKAKQFNLQNRVEMLENELDVVNERLYNLEEENKKLKEMIDNK